MSDGQTYPFSLTEQQIHDVIEAIDDVYCPSDELQAFRAKLVERRECIVDERLSRLDYDLMRHLEDHS